MTSINVEKVTQAWKFVVALVTAAGVVAATAVEALSQTGGEITTGNVITWVIAVGGALGVYFKSNAPEPIEYEEVYDEEDLRVWDDDVEHTSEPGDGLG